MAGERLDPRYDPAFQRGFSGDIEVPAPAGRGAPPEATRLETPAQTPAGRGAPPEATRLETPAQTPARRPLALRELTRNPFLLALAVLGSGLIIGGAAWANQARQLLAVRGGAATELDYWFLRTSAVAVPLLVVAGILIVAGVLFVAAVAWNGRQAAR
jgi:hypothetical protein